KQGPNDAADHEEVTERDTGSGEEERGQRVRVDDLARFRMKRGDDEHPNLIDEDRQADDDRPEDRELELDEDDVGRSERMQDRMREVELRQPRDDELRRPEEDEREDADRAARDDKTLTELPQVLRERHLFLVPLDLAVRVRRTFSHYRQGRLR